MSQEQFDCEVTSELWMKGQQKMGLPALYQIADQYLVDLDKLSDLDLPDDVVRDTLESIQGDLQEKCTNVAMYMRNLRAVADAKKAAAEEMLKQSSRLDAKADRIDAYLLENMQRCGISKIDSPWFSISRKKNPPAVVIDDQLMLDARFLRQRPAPPPSPDKGAIKESIERGEEVNGAHIEQSERLVIK